MHMVMMPTRQVGHLPIRPRLKQLQGALLLQQHATFGEDNHCGGRDPLAKG